MQNTGHNPFSLVGKRVLVTGASSGIGRACAVELSKLGADVVLVARRQEQLEETRRQMVGDYHRIEPFDLASGEEIVPWLKSLASQVGPLDGLVHAAGTVAILPARATSQKNFRQIISTNLESAFFLCKGFRQKGVRADAAAVVLVASVMGLVGQPGMSAYGASKGALIAMAKSLALELAAEAIRVNVIAPGYVQTPMSAVFENALPGDALTAIRAHHPLGIGKPEDVAYAAGYLLSDAAGWITGTTLVVDGGYTAA